MNVAFTLWPGALGIIGKPPSDEIGKQADNRKKARSIGIRVL